MAIKFLNTVAVDTDVLYVDASSNNVGIGTTSPGAKLHVDLSAYGETAKFGNGSNQLSFGIQSTYGYINAQIQGTTWRNLCLSTNGGNVGIGITSPSQKLDVAGSAQITNDIYLGRYIFHDGDTDTWLGFPLADTISFRTNGSDRMYITSTGNVGIGTTSPTSRLHVTQEQDNTFSTAIAWTASANDALNITNNDTTDTDNYTSLYMRADGSSGNFSSRIVAKNTTAGTGELHFQLRDSTHTANTETKLMIDSGGNVGIGTTSPATNLQVFGSTGVRFGNASGTGMLFADGGSTKIGSYTNHKLYLVTNNTARATVDTSGNVGIGTTSPSHPLTIVSSYPQIKIQQTGQTPSFTFGSGSGFAVFDGIGTSGSLLDIRDDGTSRMRIDASGNVGIGTTSPVDKLDVRGTARITSPQANDWIVLAQNYATGAPSGFWDSNGNVHLYLRDSSSNTNVLIKSDSSSYFNGGNVGIGTSSPGAKLDVVSGDIRLGTNAKYLRVRDTASAQPRVLGMNSANTFYIGPIDSYAGGAIAYGVSGNVTYHGFYGGGGEKVRITSAGQIGVGLTAPQTALQLYGTADDTTVGGAHRTAIRLTSTYATTFGGGGELQFGLAPSTAGRDALSVIKGAYSAFSSGNYGGDLEFHTRDADGLGLKQRMTIAHDGNVGIGTTSPGYKLDVDGDVRITQDNQLILSRSGISSASSDSCIYVDNSYTGFGNPSNIDSDISSQFGSRHAVFRYNGTIVGYIAASGTSAVSYSTTASDERLKNNIEDWQENILDKFEKIEPKKFNFISEAEGENKTKGFIAQKMVADFPEAYPSDYSEEKYYSFNPSGMVVYLMKAVKELVEKNKELENRLQILESK